MPETASLLSRIKKTPGVCGGDACIGNWRIPVWLLVSMRKQGATQEELYLDYPGVTLEELEAAWEYYRNFPEEIERAIWENHEGCDAAEEGDSR